MGVGVKFWTAGTSKKALAWFTLLLSARISPLIIHECLLDPPPKRSMSCSMVTLRPFFADALLKEGVCVLGDVGRARFLAVKVCGKTALSFADAGVGLSRAKSKTEREVLFP